MASLQIRDMPDSLYESLKNSAERDHRSLAQQALFLLATALGSRHGGKERRRHVLEEILSQRIQIKSKNIDVVSSIREDRSR